MAVLLDARFLKREVGSEEVDTDGSASMTTGRAMKEE